MWEVQHITICDGWINCWTVEEAGSDAVPQTFATRKDAEEELAYFLREIAEEIERGERDPDIGYDPEDYRIVQMAQPRDLSGLRGCASRG